MVTCVCLCLAKMEVCIMVHMKDDFFIIDKFDLDYLCFVDLKARVYHEMRVDLRRMLK